MLPAAPLRGLSCALFIWLAAVAVAKAEPQIASTTGVALSVNAVAHGALSGVRVYDVAGAWVGEVNRVITPPNTPTPAAIIEIGGFLGVGETKVLIPLDDLILRQAAQGDGLRIYVNKSDADLKALPVYHAP